MLRVAYTALSSVELERLVRALPHAEFIHAPTLSHAQRLAARGDISTLVVTEDVLRQRGYARLSVLKAAHPEVATIAYLGANADLWQDAHGLGRAQCDAVVIRGTEDRPERLREVLSLASTRSVANAVHSASAPAPPSVTPVTLERALRTIAGLRSSRALAKALGLTLAALREELRHVTLFPPKPLLAWLRLLTASRRLGDTNESVERIGLTVGYASGPAFYNACHRLVGATPQEIRDGGGLRFAHERYRTALVHWRSSRAA